MNGWQPEYMREQTEAAKTQSVDPVPVDMAMGHLQGYPIDDVNNGGTYAAPSGTSPTWLKTRIAERVLTESGGIEDIAEKGEVVDEKEDKK